MRFGRKETAPTPARRVKEVFIVGPLGPVANDVTHARSRAPENLHDGLDVRNFVLEGDKVIGRVALLTQAGTMRDFSVRKGEEGSYLWPELTEQELQTQAEFEKCDL